MARIDNGMPMIGKEYPGGKHKAVFLAGRANGLSQQPEVPVVELPAFPHQIAGDKEVAIGQE
jgi:hypothetical protein